MGLSTIVEWLNENEQRGYPLTSNSVRFLEHETYTIDLFKLIVDANFVYRDTSMPINVELTSLARETGSQVRITVKDLPPFVINVGETFPIYSYNEANDLLVLSSEVLNVLALPENTVLPISDVIFEPCVAIDMSGDLKGVESITIGSDTLAQAIKLVEGYQTDIQFGEQIISINVGRSEGIPVGCEEFFEDQISDDCSLIISNINGASPTENGGKVKIKAGNHVKIYEDKERGRIYIGLDFEESDICVDKILPPQ